MNAILPRVDVDAQATEPSPPANPLSTSPLAHAMLADLAGVPLERVAARIERALAGVPGGEEVGK